MSPSPCAHRKTCVDTHVTYYLLTTGPWGVVQWPGHRHHRLPLNFRVGPGRVPDARLWSPEPEGPLHLWNCPPSHHRSADTVLQYSRTLAPMCCAHSARAQWMGFYEIITLCLYFCRTDQTPTTRCRLWMVRHRTLVCVEFLLGRPAPHHDLAQGHAAARLVWDLVFLFPLARLLHSSTQYVVLQNSRLHYLQY